MSLSILIYGDQAGAPAGTIQKRLFTIESADPVDMQARVQVAIDEVAAFNTTIVDPDFLLTIADIDLAGAGDGHTFICTLSFVARITNPLSALLELILGGPVSFLPGNLGVLFTMASQAEALSPLVNGLAQTASLQGTSDPKAVGCLWQATRGAAKGTRFMHMIGFLKTFLPMPP